MCHNKKELRSAVAKYRELKREEARIKEELDAAKAEIYDYFDFNKIKPKEKVVGQNFIISFSECTQGRFNTQRLQEELGENLEYFKDYSTSRRIYVK